MGRVLEEERCASRETCSGFCLKTDDCLPPERCNASRYNCTTKCANDTDCHLGYICENDHCVSNETDLKDVSVSFEFDIITLLIILPFILGGLCFICGILHFVHMLLKCCVKNLQSIYSGLRGRNCSVGSLNGNLPTRTNAQQQNNEVLEINLVRLPVDTSMLYRHEQENAERLEIGLSSLPVNEANGQSVDDDIGLRGPPSYVEIFNVPEDLPPTYEEAIRDSTGISVNMYQTTEIFV